MRYLDTSFLAPLLKSEATSDDVEMLVAGQPAGTLAISSWARVELASAVARQVRMGQASARNSFEGLEVFDRALRKRFHIWIPDANDFDDARANIIQFETGLRPGDAIHLAIAKNRRAELLTLDRGMLKAAKMLGIPASSGIRLASR